MRFNVTETQNFKKNAIYQQTITFTEIKFTKYLKLSYYTQILKTTKHPKIYFFNCPEIDNYQDDIIPIAEGLNELGIPFYSLHNYWLQSTKQNDYLFKSTPEVHFTDCDVVIFTYTWFNWVTLENPPFRRPFPDNIFDKNRKYKLVYFDFSDGYQTVSWDKEFRNFDLILRCKFNKKMWHPDNVKSWAYGLTNRIIKMSSNQLELFNKSTSILSNFGASHPYEHQLRKKMRIEFLPLLSNKLTLNETIDNNQIEPKSDYDKLMWFQTCKRHIPNYYQRLNESLTTLAFCGELADQLPYNATGMYIGGGNVLKIKRFFYHVISKTFTNNTPRLIQWDSFRFWEALNASCVPIHLNLEKYGVSLPVMPIKNEHYISLDLNNYKSTIDFLVDGKAEIISMALKGRAWAFEHYSPKATAIRFLEYLGYTI